MIFLFALVFFGFVFYYMVFAGPGSDMVFSSDLESETISVRDHLEESGIKTYMKAVSPYRSMIRHRATPSVHVVHQEDRDRALQIINTLR